MPVRTRAALAVLAAGSFALSACGTDKRTFKNAATVGSTHQEEPPPAAAAPAERPTRTVGALNCPALADVESASGGVLVQSAVQARKICTYVADSAGSVTATITSEEWTGRVQSIDEFRASFTDPANQANGVTPTIQNQPEFGTRSFSVTMGASGDPGSLYTVVVPRHNGEFAQITVTRSESGSIYPDASLTRSIARLVAGR